MFKHYFKTAWRSLLRSKGFSVINIAGLAVGMASALLIILWLQNMISMDRFYPNKDRIYVMNNRATGSDGNTHAWSWTPKIMGPTLKQDYSEVEAMTRYGNGNNFLFTLNDNKKINSENGAFVDPNFFKMFSFKMLQGNADKALVGNDKIVLTKSYAKALFGDENALGKSIKIDSINYVTVSGVMQDLPNNTSFDFNYLLSWDYGTKIGWVDSSWGSNSTETFVMLTKNVSQKKFDAKVSNITINHTKETKYELPAPIYVFTQPFKDSYLYNEQVNGKYITGRIAMVRLFGVIAAFILLIACINFMNLSTARSEKRAKEVGVKKTIGATRSALVIQFIVESILLSTISFIIALGMVTVFLPFYNHLLDRQLVIPFNNVYGWLFAIAFIIFTGMAAGSYPAFYLSSFQPIKVLKGTFRRLHHKVNLRSVLVVIQFTFAIILIISTVVVTRQINYAQNRDKGYDQRGIVYTFMQGKVDKNYLLIKNELLQSGAATSVTKSMSPITNWWANGGNYTWTGSTLNDKQVSFTLFSSDADFAKTMNMQVIEGRDIDIYKYSTDSTAVVINEKAKEAMHLKSAIGTIIKRDEADQHVVGVVKNFIIGSPYDNIDPMMILGPKHGWYNVIHYKLNPAHTTAANLDKIKSIFKKYNPDYPFDYRFVDDSYAQKFKETQRISTLATLFAGLTIFISCLGLLGLVMFIAETKTKEIGIRKVLGASVFNITTLLSKDFLRLVIISFIIAAPVAWFAMNKWLLNYTYRVSIQWYWFLLAGISAMIIAIATMSWQAIKAARANPVKSLKTE